MGNTVIDEFDYIYVTVKSVTADKITKGYETLGWECVKKEVHSRYFDELNLTFRRPHLIEHKDERQLIQVYLESAVNGLGRLSSNPRPATTAFLVVVGLLLLGIVGLGVSVVFLWDGIWFTVGIVSACVGLLLYIPYGIIAVKLYGFEKSRAEKLKTEYIETAERVCAEGIRFLGDTNE